MSGDASRVERIHTAVADAFPAAVIDLIDESHLHRGHVGARGGKGHFRLVLTAPVFDGQSLLQRHRAVYAALGSLMDTDIHAVTIDAKSPRERNA